MTALPRAPEAGRFGRFGGRYVPETLIPALDELEAAYAAASSDPAFAQEADDLAKRRLRRVLPEVKPHADAFRLVFRKSDGRQSLFREIAAFLQARPLQ